MRSLLSKAKTPSPHDRVAGYIAICPGPRGEAEIAANCSTTRGQVKRSVAVMRARGGDQARHIERVFG